MERTTGEAERLLRDNFSDLPKTIENEKRIKFHASFLEYGWLNARGLVHAAIPAEQRERIDRVERLANNLWKEFYALPLFFSKGDDDLFRRLHSALYDLTGNDLLKLKGGSTVFPRKPGHIQRYREELQAIYPMHHHAEGNDFRLKVQLVDFARGVWQSLRGEAPPKSPSEGSPYFKFVANLIAYGGWDWSTERTLGAWRKLENFSDKRVDPI